ncbi:HNH endonuclease domain-containing protein [Parasporobacterium paucivorans]|uniref:HNH endonuclease n=1 Tax=Parasporobacterium paucivorans DSM 15970 TaxID=1122934 RepID=A0A1M6LLH6_9FIRM|nr:HNH endonuclease domain-containing protein [Parasporobacterium paucivorans]SHJ71952.1 HNH endonuclease [Parasporobacterium paucivorans DSM 15970]
MVESDFKKSRLERNNMLPETDNLPVHLLAGIFKDKNQSYKLFWFQAILDFVSDGKFVVTYEQLIHKMVAQAWYMVMEYHLNLGPADALEILINQVRSTSGLLPTAKEKDVIQFLITSEDENIKKAKQKLVLNVPYRLQAPFLGKLTESEWHDYHFIEERAKQNDRLLYYYEQLSVKERQIRINENWIGYLQKNEAILRGWIQNELIQYLQRRNPNVPGIPFKIHPPEKRDLKAAMNFWSAVIEHHEMNDIYTGKLLNSENFDELGRIHIDHFVPWSYLASDEVWNLTPTFAKINISKSNQVPNQKNDIELLSKQHYMALQIAQSNKEIKRLFETYTRKNLNSTDIKSRLYSCEISEEIFTENMVTLIEPICHSAKNLGFMEWVNRGFITSVL